MKLAVASGKGGTGKTLVATNLASVIPGAIYVDCDVEEPNGHIFLRPDLTEKLDVSIPIPQIDEYLCTKCGKCMEVCQYHAIIAGKRVIVFPELCHGCGSCLQQCPMSAISEKDRTIGVIESGSYAGGLFFQGKMNIGEPMSPPIIRKLKAMIPLSENIIYDSPPGTSCPMVNTVKDADFVLLVTEATPFGLHDLEIAVQTIKKIGRPLGVLLNKAGAGDEIIESYCQKENIPILYRIEHSIDIARSYAQGKLISQQSQYKEVFLKLYDNILEQLKCKKL